MRVLHVGKYFPPFFGGIENFLAELLPSLHKKGVSNFVLVHRHQLGLSAKRERIEEAQIVRVPMLGRLLYAPISPFFVFYLRRAIRTFKPDLIHVHMPNLSVFNLLLLRNSLKIPLIVHWHADVIATGNETALSLAYKCYAPFERAILKRAKAIIATSEPYLRSSKVLRDFRSKVKVVPIGLGDIPQLDPGDTDNQQTNNQFTVICIGRFTPYKAQGTLVRAIQNIDNCRLELVGNGSPQVREELLSLVTDLGVQDRVIVFYNLGPDQLQEKLQTADVLCLPSIERTEAFGVVLLEAMRVSKPVIVSDVPGSGMSWVVENERTGLHVTPGDTEQLEKAITRLREEPSLRNKMGKAARQRYLSHFQIDKVADSLLALYQVAISRSTRCSDP